MKFYYIVDDIASSENDLPAGERIFEISNLKYQFTYGDGPYINLQQLRKNSIRFKKLQKNNPKRAQKIFEKKFIIKAIEKIIIPHSIDEKLKNLIFQMIEHVVQGKATKNNWSGIHFYQSEIHRIIEITKEPNEQGIWEAKIEGKRRSKNDWIAKNRPSTFFPMKWDKNLLVLKLNEAFINKIESTSNKYIGRTNCAINIIFIIEGNKILTVYPLYS